MTGCAVDPVIDDGTEDTADSQTDGRGSAGTNSADPSQTFKTQVTPNVVNCIACHNGSLAPNLTSYAALQGKFKAKPGATNPLVTKGAHEGPAFTATQRTAIVNWIDSLPSPSETFISQVKPITNAACLACHNGNLPPNLTSYTALEGKYRRKPGATNPLVAKGAHAGPPLTAAQRNTIIDWVDSLPEPSVSYDTDVKPIFAVTCIACHNASLPPNLTSYATIAPRYKTKPGTTNPLVTKGVHAGPSLTPTQQTTVINWVDSLP